MQENANTASAIKAAAAKDNNIVKISRVLSSTYDWSYSNSKAGTDSLQKAVILTYPPMTHT